MGLGLAMDGEGHERFNSWLSRSIGLTQRETTENRQMDIVIVTEDYNRMKIRGLVGWTQRKLVGTFSGLRSLKASLAPVITQLETSKYKAVVSSVNLMRQTEVNRSKEVSTSKEGLRDSIDQVARTILSVEKHLRAGPGTKIAQRLKPALTASLVTVYKLISQFNDLTSTETHVVPPPPLTFAIVKADLVASTESLDPDNIKTLISLYWRHSENLYHFRNHLNNLRDYYDTRNIEHWSVVEAAVDRLSNSQIQTACGHLVKRRKKIEQAYYFQAGETLKLFDEAENAALFDKSHIAEIAKEFQSQTSILRNQNVKVKQ
ncbi:UNVERIFIED_CONTAM: hypothetical protein HDU68_003750 [Siphonaria sp. JEL0065]|nr:hypothetical protein HDU68_003750 [Siphonaria sp. JEL0065]